MKMAHEYADCRNVEARALVVDGRHAGRIIHVSLPTSDVVTIYRYFRYLADGKTEAWGGPNRDLGPITVKAQGGQVAYDAAVREALRERANLSNEEWERTFGHAHWTNVLLYYDIEVFQAL